eukprot:1337773-Karenia_brevis.AAC.1
MFERYGVIKNIRIRREFEPHPELMDKPYAAMVEYVDLRSARNALLWAPIDHNVVMRMATRPPSRSQSGAARSA